MNSDDRATLIQLITIAVTVLVFAAMSLAAVSYNSTVNLKKIDVCMSNGGQWEENNCTKAGS